MASKTKTMEELALEKEPVIPKRKVGRPRKLEPSKHDESKFSERPRIPSQPLLSDREEAFAKAIACGMQKRVAGRIAGYRWANAKAEASGLSILMRSKDVYWRIYWLRVNSASRLRVTIDTIVSELSIAWEVAQDLGNPAAMVQATMAKAKVLGFIDDREKDELRRPRPSPIPTDVVELSEKDWMEQFKPKRLQ
jgi:hypothetical protein